MCKLLIVTQTLKRDSAFKLIKETARRFELTQRDGFGFAAFDREGNAMARGRYYDKYKGWGRAKNNRVIETGELGSEVHTLVMHGRTSTNVRGVNYCHPFKREETYLAHNGVLSWVGPDDQRPSHKNDSGAFLEWLVANDYPAPSKWSDFWAGYGAMAIMKPDQGLRVVKCGSTRLTLTAAREGGYILSTTPYDVPNHLKAKGANPKFLHAGHLVFDKDGELLKVHKFAGFKSRAWDARASRAIGTPPPASPPLKVTNLDTRPVRNDVMPYYEQMRLKYGEDWWRS